MQPCGQEQTARSVKFRERTSKQTKEGRQMVVAVIIGGASGFGRALGEGMLPRVRSLQLVPISLREIRPRRGTTRCGGFRQLDAKRLRPRFSVRARLTALLLPRRIRATAASEYILTS